MVSLARQIANISTGGELPGGVYNSSTGAFTFASDLVFSAATAKIRSDSSDGADSKRLQITPGGAVGPSRGPYIEMFGNEYGSSVGGRMIFAAGDSADAAGSNLAIRFDASATTGAASSVVGQVTGAGAWTIGSTGSTANHLFNGSTVSFTAANSTVTLFHNYSNGSLRAQVGVNGSTGKIISVGSTNAYTIACASGIEFGDLSNNLYGSMINGVWTFGDGNLAPTSAEVRIRKTNAINNRLIEGIDAATRGYIRINSAQTNLEFEGASDRRIKTDINDLPDGLSKVMNLRPVSFKMKENTSIQCQGFIAQEFAEVFPSSVTTTDDGAGEDLPEGTPPWTMSDAVLMPYLVKAIQELKQQLDAANDRIAALEGV